MAFARVPGTWLFWTGHRFHVKPRGYSTLQNYDKVTNMFPAKKFEFCGFVSIHWGRVTHICFSELPIIVSDNGLSPNRRQAIIWTNAGILLIRTLGINVSEILSKIHTFSLKKMYLKISSGKRRPFCLDLNVSNVLYHEMWILFHNHEANGVNPYQVYRYEALFFIGCYGWTSDVDG